MEINEEYLINAQTGFETSYLNAFGAAESTYNKIAMTTNSTTSQNVYSSLAKIKGMTEWVGERQIQRFSKSQFAIANKKFENTVGVQRVDIEDDNMGMYPVYFSDLGQTAKEWPDGLVWPLLAQGRSSICYDGQNFIDSDHPVLDKDGHEVSMSNDMGGGGPEWFLTDDSRAIKPLIFQSRQKPVFTALFDRKNSHVFISDEFLYGVDARGASGFGLWQLVISSRQDLTVENIVKAQVAMQSLKGDFGRPLNLNPKQLIVPPILTYKALQATAASRLISGEDNVISGLFELHIEGRLG